MHQDRTGTFARERENRSDPSVIRLNRYSSTLGGGWGGGGGWSEGRWVNKSRGRTALLYLRSDLCCSFPRVPGFHIQTESTWAGTIKASCRILIPLPMFSQSEVEMCTEPLTWLPDAEGLRGGVSQKQARTKSPWRVLFGLNQSSSISRYQTQQHRLCLVFFVKLYQNQCFYVF